MEQTTIIKHGTPEWFNARKGKITGSSAAAILAPGQPGVRGTPLSEWHRITTELSGETPEAVAEDTAFDEDDQGIDTSLQEILDWGSSSEEFHAEMLRRSGFVVTLNRNLLIDPRREWLAGTPDGMISAVDDGTEASVLEMKAPVHNFQAWRDGPTVGAQIQASIYMHLMDLDSAIVSALIPPKPRWHTVIRNDEWEAWALDKLDRFWHGNVLADIPPEATGTDTDIETLKLIYPDHQPGLVVRLTDAHLSAVVQLEQAKALKKQAEAMEADAKAAIIAAIGDAEYAVCPDGSGFTYRTTTRNEPPRDARAVQYRTLRFSKNLKV